MKRKQKGFTIVEMLIYTGILLIVLYIFTSIFSATLDVQLESQTQSAIIQDSGYILSRLSHDMTRASSIVQPASLGQVSSSMQLVIGGTTYTYAPVNNSLQVTDASGSVYLNSYGTTVSNVSFRRYGNVSGKNSVSIAFTLTSTTQRTGGYESQDFQTTMGLR
jgi:type II secretory pathway pseudopilin PulG